MLEVYIVNFVTGEYDDQVSCIDKIFLNEDKANIYVKNMNDSLMEDNLHYDNCELNYHENLNVFAVKYKHSVSYVGSLYNIEGPYGVIK